MGSTHLAAVLREDLCRVCAHIAKALHTIKAATHPYEQSGLLIICQLDWLMTACLTAPMKCINNGNAFVPLTNTIIPCNATALNTTQKLGVLTQQPAKARQPPGWQRSCWR